jgi:hypothetical protein
VKDASGAAAALEATLEKFDRTIGTFLTTLRLEGSLGIGWHSLSSS